MSKLKKDAEKIKKEKVVKEKDIIKKSDFEDENDNKKIVIVALILALLIGGFAYIRSLDNKEEEKEPIQNITIEKEEEEEVDIPVVEEQKPSTENTYVPTTTPTPPKVEEVVVDVFEELKNIPTKLEAGEEIELPEIKAIDGEEEITAEISYMYRESEESEYTAVTEIDTTKLGQYKITYTLSYQDGKVETKEVEISITDNTEPVLNNVKDGEFYNDESILLDITEYSPYKVEVNEVEYDESLPLTDEGEYKVVVTELTDEARQITVTIVIDRTKPVITVTEELEGTVVTATDETLLDTFVITKDGVEHDVLEPLTEDGEYKIVATDKAGNSAEEVLVIDTTAPEVEVVYTPDNSELTDGKVEVVITANEEIQAVDGWTLSEDKLTLTKEFAENKVEIVKVKDIAENITEVEIIVDYIDYNVEYKPELTIENLVTNQVKATITSVKQLTFADSIKDEWLETYDEEAGIYTYEKIYTEAKEETLDYTYEDEDGNPVAGQIKIAIEGVTIVDTLVTYDIDATTQNVKVTVITDEEIEVLPEGWARDDEYMAEDFKYYKVYIENVEYELVEFASANKNYVAAITIDTIDREAPTYEVDVTYEEENNEKKSVTITVTVDEEIKPVEGWTLAEDQKSISKKIDRPSEVTTEEILDDVTIADLKGNESTVDFSYNWNVEQSTE